MDALEASRRRTAYTQGKHEVEDTYDGAEQREEAALGLVELLPGVGFEVERGLARLLVRGRVQLDLVVGHDLLRDVAQRRRLAVLAAGGEVDGREHERVRHLGLLRRRGLDARACVRAPRRRGGSLGRLRGWREGREGLLRVGVDGAVGRRATGLGDRGVVDKAGERVRCALELVPPLAGNVYVNVGSPHGVMKRRTWRSAAENAMVG